MSADPLRSPHIGSWAAASGQGDRPARIAAKSLPISTARPRSPEIGRVEPFVEVAKGGGEGCRTTKPVIQRSEARRGP